MRILLTGAGGFTGSAVLRRLHAQGHPVIAVDRSPEALARVAAQTPGTVTHVVDLASAGAVAGAVDRLLREERPDALIHLAWYTDPADYLTSHQNLASLAATNALVEAALATGCRKLVVGGSCVEYAVRDRPLRETDE